MSIEKRTQVGIIGAGPSGQLLARLLHRKGIDVVVLERRSREYVEGRIRAGVLEQGTAAVLELAGAAERMRTDGLEHDGFLIAFDGRVARVDLQKYGNSPVFVYGQTEVTKDLNRLNEADGIPVHYGVEVTTIRDLDGDAARIVYKVDGKEHELACDYAAGCDGYHGASRRSMPDSILREFKKTYPFGWLGVLSNTRPASHELVYSNHSRGFALCSQRSTSVSRNYIQVPADERVEAWSDDAFWDELRRRLPAEIADPLETGVSVEKSIAPLRSFIAEPLRCGRLFLVGDAGHIVPPTGAKGMNLAASDAAMLASSLGAFYADRDSRGLERYSETALDRIWKAERFSWWFTMASHRLSDNPFDLRMQVAELDYYTGTRAGLTSIAENYVGLPIEDPVTGGTIP
ncbi:MAG: 4-hydroxybenzoate 3-monooxygenase [Gammaproteobacteria bacterium]|nr:4-hydroxybenzoate 3-monooxygenase [Gammaproteobacteria bacterium]MDH4253280.1 4-hydroxybenzoate 3-monooxygenase [Gammaproteobacteria bacterium]MDH5310245.1 4-hydroxybenzoate 3-monooxygenase [Gammaproteobacteria bacterium]